jgi:hypothetical protein
MIPQNQFYAGLLIGIDAARAVAETADMKTFACEQKAEILRELKRFLREKESQIAAVEAAAPAPEQE